MINADLNELKEIDEEVKSVEEEPIPSDDEANYAIPEVD